MGERKSDFLHAQPSDLTPDGIQIWRDSFRLKLFDVFSTTSTLEEFVAASSKRPGVAMYSDLYETTMLLVGNVSGYISEKPLLENAIKTSGLTEDETLKRSALVDLVRVGERILSTKLSATNSNDMTEDGIVNARLNLLGVSPNKLSQLREVVGVTVHRESITGEWQLAEGDLALDVLAAANLLPSPEATNRILLLKQMLSGDGINIGKTMLIGTSCLSWDYDLVDVVGQQTRALLHEIEHGAQPSLPGVIQELGAYAQEIEGLNTILQLPDSRFPKTHPLYPSDLRRNLERWRDRISQARMKEILVKFSASSPAAIIDADHNIAAVERENDMEARGLVNQRLTGYHTG
ncbi:MAG: hypothetical protein RLZZ455_279 [Candidatus Parcubacteria bacterium]|jgi:hypothetical protein